MTNRSEFSWDRYKQSPIVGILRGVPKDTVIRIARSYVEAELYTLEITMNTENAGEIIGALVKEFPELNVGAGTVCELNQYHNARAAGAQFIVMPVLGEDVMVQAVKDSVPIFPGAFTPTEIYRAWNLGASAVKVFPATQLGAQYIKEVRAPLDQIRLLPTGGVNRSNIRSFFEAGAVGVGMGGSLFDRNLIREKKYQELEKHFIQIKREIQGFIEN